MPAPRHLRNAPIREAIIDYRVKARPNLKAEDLGALRPELAKSFPRIEDRRAGAVMIEIAPGVAKPPRVEDLGLQGFFAHSADSKTIIQCRVDGFTFNRLRPYTSWEELFPVAAHFWTLYRGVAAPEAITRLAVRYVNHIELPPELKDFDDYLRAGPVIPQELPQELSAFFTRMTIGDPATDIAANIVQALQVDIATRKLAVILDIDAYKGVDLPPDSPAIDAIFERLRAFKNLVFFNSVTDLTLGLFE